MDQRDPFDQSFSNYQAVYDNDPEEGSSAPDLEIEGEYDSSIDTTPLITDDRAEDPDSIVEHTDEYEDTITSLEANNEPLLPTRRGGRKASPQRRKEKLANIRSTVIACFELAAAPDHVKSRLAQIIGCGENDKDIALAVLTGDINIADGLKAFKALRSVDPFDMGVELVMAGRQEMKKMWTLLSSLSGDNSPLNPSDPKAARQIGSKILQIDDAEWALLEQVENLVKAMSAN